MDTAGKGYYFLWPETFTEALPFHPLNLSLDLSHANSFQF